jgi:hypothetical protein
MADHSNMTVEELRREARRKHVEGASRMRKKELVEALERSGGRSRGGNGGGGEPRGDSKSVRYSQKIRSTEDEPERPGRSLVTRDHEVIRQWAEERDAVPATIEGTEHEGRPGVLRFDFGGDDSGGRMRHISWDEWFGVFDERKLNFVYQEQRVDGRESNFFRLDNPDREDG